MWNSIPGPRGDALKSPAQSRACELPQAAGLRWALGPGGRYPRPPRTGLPAPGSRGLPGCRLAATSTGEACSAPAPAKHRHSLLVTPVLRPPGHLDPCAARGAGAAFTSWGAPRVRERGRRCCPWDGLAAPAAWRPGPSGCSRACNVCQVPELQGDSQCPGPMQGPLGPTHPWPPVALL